MEVPGRGPSGPVGSSEGRRRGAVGTGRHEGRRERRARRVEGEPLELQERCAHHLAAESLVLGLGQLHARSLAIVARRAAEATEENVEEWLGDRACEAADQLIHEEHFEERLGCPPQREADPRAAFLMGALGIEPALARGVSVNFHRMSRDVRRTFWRAVVSGESIAGIAEEEGSTRDTVLVSLRGVIRSMSLSGVRGSNSSVLGPGEAGQEST